MIDILLGIKYHGKIDSTRMSKVKTGISRILVNKEI